MISGIFHQGSGIGNQLHRYVATRILAADNGYTFGMVAPQNSKVSSFMTLDMGEDVPCTWTIGAGGAVIPISSMATWSEEKVTINNVDIRGYDPEFNFVKDNTIIDGEFQDERYFMHRLREVNQWLKVDYLGMPDNLCVVGFRGGEFQYFPELFLTQDYWEKAIRLMKDERPDMKFIAVTDDPETAARILPDEVKIANQDAGNDWRMVRHANYLIIANSSFYILPSLLNNHVKKVIAPRFWARRNVGIWSTKQNYYSKFSYI